MPVEARKLKVLRSSQSGSFGGLSAARSPLELCADKLTAALMTAVQQLRCFEPPTDGDYLSVRRYLYETKPLMDLDMNSFRAKDDLGNIAYHSPEKTALPSIVDRDVF